VGRYAMLHESR